METATNDGMRVRTRGGVLFDSTNINIGSYNNSGRNTYTNFNIGSNINTGRNTCSNVKALMLIRMPALIEKSGSTIAMTYASRVCRNQS